MERVTRAKEVARPTIALEVHFVIPHFVELLESRRLLSGTTSAAAADVGDSLIAPPHKPRVAAQAITVEASASSQFSGTVATLRRLSGVPPDLRNLQATIDWGDGSAATAASFVRGKTGVQIRGSHTYAQAGTFDIVVSAAKGPIAPRGLPQTSFPDPVAQVHGFAHILPQQDSSGVTIRETAGQSFTAMIGTFQFSLVGLAIHIGIDWGDGSSSAGTRGAQAEAIKSWGRIRMPSQERSRLRSPSAQSPVGKPGQPVPLFVLLVANIRSTAIVTS